MRISFLLLLLVLHRARAIGYCKGSIVHDCSQLNRCLLKTSNHCDGSRPDSECFFRENCNGDPLDDCLCVQTDFCEDIKDRLNAQKLFKDKCTFSKNCLVAECVNIKFQDGLPSKIVKTDIVLQNMTMDMRQLCNGQDQDTSITIYIEHTTGGKRYATNYVIKSGTDVVHPQHKIEGMAVDAVLGTSTMHFQVYGGGAILGKRHNARTIKIFIDALHMGAGDTQVWAGSKMLSKATGLPVYTANGIYDLSKVCHEHEGIAVPTGATTVIFTDPPNPDTKYSPGATTRTATTTTLETPTTRTTTYRRSDLNAPQQTNDGPDGVVVGWIIGVVLVAVALVVVVVVVIVLKVNMKKSTEIDQVDNSFTNEPAAFSSFGQDDQPPLKRDTDAQLQAIQIETTDS